MVTAGCIKEDRSQCPCHLHVDLSRIDAAYVDKLDLVLSDPDGTRAQWYDVDDRYIGDTLVMKVDKSDFDFCAWGNLRESIVDQRTGAILTAGEPDTLWSSYQRVSAKCEDRYITVVPQRRYVPVTIIVRGMINNISEVTPTLTRISQSFDYNGNPMGKLVASYPKMTVKPKTPEDYYQFELVLLTQQNATDAGLELSYSEDGLIRKASYPLGKMLLEEGEDISLADGHPILLDLMLGRGNIFLTIEIEEWKQHDVIDITY